MSRGGPLATERRISIYILSDNRLHREALARILKKRPDFQVAGVSGTDTAEFDGRALEQADVLLLDSSPDLLDRAEELRDLRHLRPDQKILLLGMEETKDAFLEAVRNGIAGCVLRDASADDVVEGVRAVGAGEAVCPPRLCRYLFEYVQENRPESRVVRAASLARLTRRERQLVPLLGRGLTNKEIAAEFNLSEQTVKNHIHRILRKVGANGRVAIADICRSETVAFSASR